MLSRADYDSPPAAAAAEADGRGSPPPAARVEEDGEDDEPLEAEDGLEEFVEIIHGQAFTDRKSTFQAHLARVSSENQARNSRCRRKWWICRKGGGGPAAKSAA